VTRYLSLTLLLFYMHNGAAMGGEPRIDVPDAAMAAAATADRFFTARTARVGGDVAWVASESELRVEKDGKATSVASAETMVLRSTASGWKIVHIHWSSHAKKS